MSAYRGFLPVSANGTNLVRGVGDGEFPNIFVRDRRLGRTEAVPASLDHDVSLALSADGRFVAYVSHGSSVGGVSYGPVFLRDRRAGTTVTVSVARDGTPAPGGFNVAISADGGHVAFDSVAKNLVRHDTNRRDDVFVRDR